MVTTREESLELHQRSWEAIDSLLRTLGSTLDLSEVVQRSLLTVSGQLLTPRAALYLLGENAELEFCESLGIRRGRLGNTHVPLEKSFLQHVEFESAMQTIFSSKDLPDPLNEHFEFVAPISDGENLLALLLLGGRVGSGEFGEQDLSLLHTMGTVLGASIQRSMAYESVVEAKERLERVQHLQQQIIDHVSHEFNTPLMILKSSIDFYRNADAEQRGELRAMHDQAVDRLEKLITSIMEVGQVAPRSSLLIPMSQSDIVELCLMPALDASGWPSDRIRIEHEIDESVRILADAQVLQRALCALLNNAWCFAGSSDSGLGLVTYVAEGRRRRVEDLLPRQERLSALLSDQAPDAPCSLLPTPSDRVLEPDTLVIEIADAGIGIPESEWATVFEPFTQASNSPTRHVSGTGMGLALARRRVEAMGGEIALASREGAGSLFVVLLPVLPTSN